MRRNQAQKRRTNYRFVGDKIAQFIQILLSVIQVILIFYALLVGFSANPEHPLVNFVITLATPLLQPFAGIVDPIPFAGALFDPTVLIAILVYALLGALLVRLIKWFFGIFGRDNN